MSNLEERTKIETLKEALNAVFKHYGTIVDIVAKSSLKRKGQAFVVFDNEDSADRALQMNNFEMYGKQMKVAKARTHSDETVKRQAAGMFDEHKRKRLTLKGKHSHYAPNYDCVLTTCRHQAR